MSSVSPLHEVHRGQGDCQGVSARAPCSTRPSAWSWLPQGPHAVSGRGPGGTGTVSCGLVRGSGAGGSHSSEPHSWQMTARSPGDPGTMCLLIPTLSQKTGPPGVTEWWQVGRRAATGAGGAPRDQPPGGHFAAEAGIGTGRATSGGVSQHRAEAEGHLCRGSHTERAPPAESSHRGGWFLGWWK